MGAALPGAATRGRRGQATGVHRPQERRAPALHGPAVIGRAVRVATVIGPTAAVPMAIVPVAPARMVICPVVPGRMAITPAVPGRMVTGRVVPGRMAIVPVAPVRMVICPAVPGRMGIVHGVHVLRRVATGPAGRGPTDRVAVGAIPGRTRVSIARDEVAPNG